jgi:hypothetical protein
VEASRGRRVRWFRYRLRRRLSALLLLDERGGPLVRAMLTSTRRARRRGGAVAAGVPLLVWIALLVDVETLTLLPSGVPEAVAGWFACLWPLLLFLGAAAAAAAATVSERESGGAVQLVLTPVSKREIAASKVLPAALIFLPGALAALPLCVWLGGSRSLLLFDRFPAVQAAWPIRGFIPMFDSSWELELTPVSFVNGLVMCAGDLCAVWAGAHWGAGLGVRLGRLPLALLFLVPRALLLVPLTALIWVASWGPGSALGSAVVEDGTRLAPALSLLLASLIGLPIFGLCWWFVLYLLPVSGCLENFERFDRLADDDFRPLLRPRFDPRALREHIRTRRH